MRTVFDGVDSAEIVELWNKLLELAENLTEQIQKCEDGVSVNAPSGE